MSGPTGAGSNLATASASSLEVCTKLQILFYKLRTMNYSLSPEQRLACQRTFIVSTEIHYNINNCAFPAKLDSYHTSAVDPVLGTQKLLYLLIIRKEN